MDILLAKKFNFPNTIYLVFSSKLFFNHFKDLNQISSISSSPSVKYAINLFFLPMPISLIFEISPII